MATSFEAQAVKSLNKSPGRRRFVFKKFSERVDDIDIGVFRSLDPLKVEPSEGSSFFRDCLLEWRELNTAEDFITFYEEMTPLVQSLPQIILHKDFILTQLLSRLKMKARLSLEPILRLIAELSRDILGDFLPFLQRIADTFVLLLQSGAEKEPEIIEQIFTSWSSIMMYLQKYLVKDVVHVLRVTLKLRYYPKVYIQEFMAESVSFLLRNAPPEHLIKGARKVMLEYVKKPVEIRKSGASALLCYTMRGTSSRLHSKAAQLLRLLLDNSIFNIGSKLTEGSDIIVEVVIETIRRICEEIEPTEMNVIFECLHEEIDDSWNNGNSLHLKRLLSVLISTLQVREVSDYEPVIQLVEKLLKTEVNDEVLKLILCIIDGLHSADDHEAISQLSLQWSKVFDLRNSSLQNFIKELVLKDPSILRSFRVNILSVLINSVETSEEEDIIYLLLNFCERLQVKSSILLLDGVPVEDISKIRNYLKGAISRWIKMIDDAGKGDPHNIQLEETKLAMHWGIISCYPYLADNSQSNQSLLMDLVDSLDRLLVIDSEIISGHSKDTWQSIIGAALSSYHKLNIVHQTAYEESSVSRFLNLAKKYKTSTQILSAVADFTDSIFGSRIQEHTANQMFHPDYESSKVAEAFGTFAENLSHSDKHIRISTLRILGHYETLNSPKESATEFSSIQDANILQLLYSVETTPISIATSRQVILQISKIQMTISTSKISEPYLPIFMNGIIGIFHNRFSHFWNPAMECLSVLISQYFGILWEKYVQFLDRSISIFLTSSYKPESDHMASSEKSSELFEIFKSFTASESDSTPGTTVLSLLIQSLQKIPALSESRSRQIVPLFLKFLGYNVDDLSSVKTYESHVCKGKEWQGILKEWLNLLILMKNTKSFYLSQFLKEVLQFRLLDSNEAEIQMKVLDCLLNWKDEYLVPYGEHLKNLISTKTLREELTKWSLSKEMNLIDERHRFNLVPIVIRVLVPKIRKLKTLASRKAASVHSRKAILGFLSQLEVEELPLFYTLLIDPLRSISQGLDWNFVESSAKSFDWCNILKHFTVDNIKALSWKKRYGFLHVIEDMFGVFDKIHINPFLDMLMGCVVRILASCSSSPLEISSSELLIDDKNSGLKSKITISTDAKQFKDVRSLCLKIFSNVLNKYDDHEFGSEFWDLFFKSIKPLIDGLKQEGASSEKPSSLLSCFLIMSESYKLIPLLNREKNLVPDIFSILTVDTASDAIISYVLKFIANLLDLDSEMMDSEVVIEVDNGVKRILLENLDVLVSSLHHLFTCKNATKRKLVKSPGEREIIIFKLLSKYIKDPSAASKFVDILLPLLTRKLQNPEASVETLQVIRHVMPLLGPESTLKILHIVSPIIISGGQDVRLSICDLLDTLAETDASVQTVAKLLRQLNATSTYDLGGLDYDVVLDTYEKIDINLFYSVREEHASVILAHFVHDMSSEELILRQSAFRIMLLFVDFCGKILNEEGNEGQWSSACIQRMINNFLFKHMGDAMIKDSATQKAWIDLLREMVVKLPQVPHLKSFKELCSEDPEQDFFKNITHLQKHRRAKALTRFNNVVSLGNLSEVIINKVFFPLLFNMLFDIQDGKGEHLRISALESIASISGIMEWKQYYALLTRIFKELTLKPDKQKLLLRLICSILDHFHFLKTDQETLDSLMDSEIRTCLYQTIYPKIQKLLMSDSEGVNVNVSLVALKILKLSPGEVMDVHLPSIIHRISNFLKNRLDSVRDDARTALAACLKELGLEYLQFIVKVLRATLKKGFEVHVLGYTLNFILLKSLSNPVIGKLDYCLGDLLSVVENDILGDVSDEKDVDKIASKMKETRKRKSLETLKLISQNVTFKSHGCKLLSPVIAHMQRHLTPKTKLKLEAMLKEIAAGIESNPSVDQTDLLIFTHNLIKDGINNKIPDIAALYPKKSNQDMDKVTSNPQTLHLITGFALGVLHNRLKNMKLIKDDIELMSKLDPFVEILSDCLTSKFEDIISTALRCLSLLVKLPLQNLEKQADKIKSSILIIAQGSLNANSQLMQSCIKLLTVLLRSTRITLSSDQLHMLIQFPLFVDLEKNPSALALALLKAIVNRKLVVHEIYDLVTRVSELMVTSQDEPVRKKCSQILLQFLLDYRLSQKRLQQHLDFLLSNLRYEHPSGREAVLEMLHVIIMKFPVGVIDEHCQTFFVQLVVCLANDNDNKVRSMTGVAIKMLIKRVSQHSHHTILTYTLSWYVGGKQHLWSAAAQVLGLLVEVLQKGFQKHINTVLPVTRTILQSAISIVADKKTEIASEVSTVPFWKEAYYSLVLFEKIINQFPDLCFGSDVEDIWEMICEFLLHPHTWLRNISNRLISVYFTLISEYKKTQQKHNKSLTDFYLMKPSRLFLIAVSLSCQLKSPSLSNESAHVLITNNLVFSICELHSILGKEEYANPNEFWSTLNDDCQSQFLKGFHILDSRKGRNIFASLVGQNNEQQNRYLLVSYLLKKMGKTVLQMEATQMKIVFSVFKLILPKFFDSFILMEIGDEESQNYFYHIVQPLYKVVEGFAGKAISDDVIQVAQDVCKSIQVDMGAQNYLQVYGQIRKNLKAKRDKRRQEEKIMAVVNPERNAKRKLRNAAKHRAHKKRKLITIKTARWIR
jgi:U3 small nucleolar RNA-associated protein 20